jgi:hypothetical protein
VPDSRILLRRVCSPCCAQQIGMHTGCGSTAYLSTSMRRREPSYIRERSSRLNQGLPRSSDLKQCCLASMTNPGLAKQKNHCDESQLPMKWSRVVPGPSGFLPILPILTTIIIVRLFSLKYKIPRHNARHCPTPPLHPPPLLHTRISLSRAARACFVKSISQNAAFRLRLA